MNGNVGYMDTRSSFRSVCEFTDGLCGAKSPVNVIMSHYTFSVVAVVFYGAPVDEKYVDFFIPE